MNITKLESEIFELEARIRVLKRIIKAVKAGKKDKKDLKDAVSQLTGFARGKLTSVELEAKKP